MPPAGERWTPDQVAFLCTLWEILLPLPAASGRIEALKVIEAEIFPPGVAVASTPARACCEPAPDRSGRVCDKPKGHDGNHWTYGGDTLAWGAVSPSGWTPERLSALQDRVHQHGRLLAAKSVKVAASPSGERQEGGS